VAGSSSEFVEYLSEVFCDFGAIETRRMFGGYGVYHDDVMFAIVAADELFLKADSVCEHEFTSRGLARFEYLKQGRAVRLSFYAAPEEIYDDPDVARHWAVLACDAALRSRRK